MTDELKTQPAEEQTLLRIHEVAARLGLKTRLAAYQYVWSGELPGIYLNKRTLRVQEKDLTDFINRRRTGNMEATVR